MKKFYFLFSALFITSLSFGQVPVASTSFEVPVPDGQYVDTGDANVAHDLTNNAGQSPVDFTSASGEMGYDARYVPFGTPSVGLTDGDFVGVTNYTGSGVTAYPDGIQGYQFSDTDGTMVLEFDPVDLTAFGGNQVSIDYFIQETGWESTDVIRIYVKNLTNSTEIDILNTTGSDIDDLSIEAAWTDGTVGLPNGITAQLVIEFTTNSGSEAMFIDDVKFTRTYVLSTKENQIDGFDLYPNPTKEAFVTISSDNRAVMKVSVYDILGKQVIERTITNNRLNISNLNTGVYILRAQQDNAFTTRKLVIN